MNTLFQLFFEGSLFTKISTLIYSVLVSLGINNPPSEIINYQPKNAKLYHEIIAMDRMFFEAYNTCNFTVQRELLSEDIEFFHDKTGLETSKEAILTSLKNNICNKITRNIVQGSVEVYPINNYGAVQIGYHTFTKKETPNKKSKPLKFITIWKKENNQWLIARVISLH